MRTILGPWSVHKPFKHKQQRCCKKDHLIHGSVPLPIHPVHLLPHLLYSFCNHTYPSHEEMSSKRPFTEIKSSWPYNGTSIFFFFSVFWLFPLKTMLVPPFVLNYIPASICSITLCPYAYCAGLSSFILHTLHTTPLPSTLRHVKTTLSYDPECLDIGCKRNSWSAIPPE